MPFRNTHLNASSVTWPPICFNLNIWNNACCDMWRPVCGHLDSFSIWNRLTFMMGIPKLENNISIIKLKYLPYIALHIRLFSATLMDVDHTSYEMDNNLGIMLDGSSELATANDLAVMNGLKSYPDLLDTLPLDPSGNINFEETTSDQSQANLVQNTVVKTGAIPTYFMYCTAWSKTEITRDVPCLVPC